MRWSRAQQTCKHEGGKLLTIRSDEELAAILPLIPIGADGRHEDIHVGLRMKLPLWQWMDGSNVQYDPDEFEGLTWATGYDKEL